MHWTCKWEAVGVTPATNLRVEKSVITVVLYWCSICTEKSRAIIIASA